MLKVNAPRFSECDIGTIQGNFFKNETIHTLFKKKKYVWIVDLKIVTQLSTKDKPDLSCWQEAWVGMSAIVCLLVSLLVWLFVCLFDCLFVCLQEAEQERLQLGQVQCGLCQHITRLRLQVERLINYSTVIWSFVMHVNTNKSNFSYQTL